VSTLSLPRAPQRLLRTAVGEPRDGLARPRRAAFPSRQAATAQQNAPSRKAEGDCYSGALRVRFSQPSAVPVVMEQQAAVIAIAEEWILLLSGV
jgi:hypothetical protein